MSGTQGDGLVTENQAKLDLRREALRHRAEMSPGDRDAQSSAIAEAVWARAASAQVIAAYIPFGSEPGTTALLDRLSAHATVIVPFAGADGDLDWVAWTGADDLVAVRPGSRLLRPIGPTLGARFIADADLLLVPALLVAMDGARLGRGGGSYDRALPRAGGNAPIAALLFDGELVERLPVQDWDVPVSAVVTAQGGWTELAR